MEDKQFTGNWIKLHRGLLDSYISTESEALHLWITILLSANHKENSFVFNGKKITVQAGEFITGRKALSAKTKISEWKIIRLLKLFESEHQITQQKTNKYTIISITNWAKYQQDTQQNAQQTNNRPTTDQQQKHTNKNDKKEKNDKNDKNIISKHLSGADIIKSLPLDFNQQDIIQSLDKWLDYKKTEKRQTYKSARSFVELAKKFTPTQLVEAIDFSIMQSYQGIFAPSGNKSNFVPYVKQTNFERNMDTLKTGAEMLLKKWEIEDGKGTETNVHSGSTSEIVGLLPKFSD